MTLNLNKYGSEMQAAWKEVCDVNSETNWALFGYEGTSFTLKLLASGSDGLEELKEELNANKIMYAFIRVDDPKTSLPKFVFIHWQGESAAGTRKGVCATHLRDIERYFHGAHVTINARNEDEVDESEILSKVSKATASAFNFKEKPCTMMDEAPAPVGTTHQRIVPQKELPTMNERENFWIQEESKEKERIEAEKIRKISERKLIEEERRRREEEENKLREASIKERERKISKIRDAEATTKKDNSSEWEKQLEDDAKEEESRQKRSEELRKARNEEARQLISQRSGNARAVFERNTSVGQLNYRRSTSLQQNGEENRNLTAPVVPAIKPSEAPASPQAAPAPVSPLATPVSPQAVPAPASPKASPPQASPAKSPEPKFDVRKSEARSPNLNHVNANVVHTDDIVVPPPEFFSNEDMMKPEEVFCEPDITSNSHQPDLIQDVAASKVVPDVTASAGHTSASVQNGSSTDYGVCAVALYDYEAADETEISFDPGQVITHIDQIDPGWWQGLGPDGNYGLFPANYVEIIDSSEIEQH